MDLLIELENTGLVISRTLSRGRHGYGTEYRLKVSPYIVAPIIDAKWWDERIKSKLEREKLEELLRTAKRTSLGRELYRHL